MRKEKGRIRSRYILDKKELGILGGDAGVWEELVKKGRFDRFDPPEILELRLRNGSPLARELDEAAKLGRIRL